MGSLDWERQKKTLDIQPPLARCGYCGFTTALTGAFAVEDGRLVFRADPDPQPRRGPDLEGCCEGRECGRFEHIAADDRELTADEVAALRAAARDAQRDELKAWREMGAET